MIKFDLNFNALLNIADELKPAIDKEINEANRLLALQAYSHIVEDVQTNLKSTRDLYLSHLHLEQADDSTWVITLDSDALWLEDGMPSHDMKPDMLASPKAKTSKDGSTYLVVPFKHNKNPSSQTGYQKSLTDAIKQELKQKKIPYKKIETGPDGKPLKGLVHSFNGNTPNKTHHGAGQGKGPIGQPRQGVTGIPHLNNLRIYQKEVATKSGGTKMQRDILTFRVVSTNSDPSSWQSPGIVGKKFLDSAYDWAMKELEKIRETVATNVTKSF